MIEKQEKIILLCDNPGEHIDRVIQLLHESQYKVILESNPRKIFEICIDNPVVALVLEIQLLENQELLQTFNKKPHTKHLPIIITTKEKPGTRPGSFHGFFAEGELLTLYPNLPQSPGIRWTVPLLPQRQKEHRPY